MRPAFALLVVLSAAAVVYKVWSPSPEPMAPVSATDQATTKVNTSAAAAAASERATAASVRPRAAQLTKVNKSESGAPATRLSRTRPRERQRHLEPGVTQETANQEQLPQTVSAADAEAYESQKQQTVSRQRPATATVPPSPRWINELSGQKAKLNMGKARAAKDCRSESTNCGELTGSHDIKVVGVLIKSERLVKPDDNAIIDGQVKRGDHAQGTPALYLQ